MLSSKELRDKAKELVDAHYGDNHKKRLTHIYGVAEMAGFLAERMGLDKYRAEAAGYMHDYSKYDDFDLEKLYLSDEDQKECEKYPFLYHAYLSAYHTRELLTDDEEIYQAVRNHVFGRPGMSTLEAIVMIADFTEKNRTYDDCIRCRHILVDDGDFNLAIVESLKATIKHCEEEGDIPHPKQMLVLREYEERVKKNKMTLEEILIDCVKKVRGTDIIVYDMMNRSPFYDKMILASVDSLRQANAVTGYIEDAFKDTEYKIRNVEGGNTAWVLVDCNDIILSLFTKEEREHFALEKIYMDYPATKIED